MTNTFKNIIADLDTEDLDTVRGFIRDTVRAEWGTLIADLSARTYPESDESMPEDPWLDKGPEPTESEDAEPTLNVRDYKGLLGYLGLSGITIRFDL